MQLEEYRKNKVSSSNAREQIRGETYLVKNPGPYPWNAPNLNKVRFTPVQTAAIRSGVSEGLTMVVGPPGTGKTDTAVQIVNLLFHNYPEQRICLVAHSNQALNDLFEKVGDMWSEGRRSCGCGFTGRRESVVGEGHL